MSALGHAYGEWVIITPATKTEDGLREQSCTRCSELVNRETIPAGSVGLDFSLNANSYYVSGIGTCTDTDIVIPAKYNGKPVTGIGDAAFANCSSLTSITIPEGVTSIGMSAFDTCTSLTSITIPSSVTRIAEKALIYCSSLTSIQFNGTKAHWEAMTTGYWYNGPAIQIICSDGVVSIG